MVLQSFLAELKRRGVHRAAAIYAAAAWGLLQVADVFSPLLGWSDQGVTLVLILATLGFPLMLVFAWFYDLSGGLHLTEPLGEVPAKPLPPRRLWEFGLIFVLVLTVGYLYYDRFSLEREIAEQASTAQSKLSTPAIADKSVAVMPFVNIGDGEEHAYFGDGLAEEILNLLAKIEELKVAARTSSFNYEHQDTDLRELAQTLGVRYVLEGAVRLSNDQVRITAQLVDAESGYNLWSETYNRKIEDIFSIQDDIARRVVTALQVILTPEQGTELAVRSTDNIVAYQLYLRARTLMRDGSTPDNLDQAISLLRQALAEDPDFVNAHAGLCDAYLQYFTRKRDANYFDVAEESCRAALALDDSGSTVYVALGNLYNRSGQAELATEQFEAAIRLSPNLFEAHSGLARSFEAREMEEEARLGYQRVIDLHPADWRGRYEMGAFLHMNGQAVEAIPHYTRAAELAPENADVVSGLGAAFFDTGDFQRAAAAFRTSLEISPNAIAYSNTGTSYFYLGNFDKAAEMYLKALELTPEDFELWGSLGDSYMAMGNGAEKARESYTNAIRYSEEMLRINPEDVEVLAQTAHYHANLGQSSSARALMARIEALGSDDMFVYYTLALTRARLGDISGSVEDLQRSVALGYRPELLEVDPGFFKLAQIPEFQALITQYGGTN